MTATLDVTCPSCGKALKVPAQAEGKRVKCKGCLEVFLVKGSAKEAVHAAAPAPAKKPAPKKPAEKPADKPAPPAEMGHKPKAPEASADRYKVTWDDEADNDQGAVGVIKEEDVPRCPLCAKELDPPDAIVCIHCGFNNRTRAKAETKAVYEPTGADWTTHLLPGVLAVAAVVALIILDVVCLVNMRGWMEGGLLELSDTKGADGNPKLLVSPGFFIALVFFATLAAIVPAVKFAYKRLIVNYRPPETLLK